MIYEGKAITVKALESGIVELNFDLKGESVNKFNRLTLNDLRQAVDAIKADASVKGVIVTSGKDVFIVGADITEFVDNFKLPDEELVAGNLEANKIFSDFEDLGVPTVVAINGIALGGGFEMCMAADYRVMSTTAKVGLPEVKLGIYPGFGGTVRLPRLIGVDNAVEWIASGKENRAEDALKVHAVDAVVAPEKPQEAALDLVKRAISGELDYKAKRQPKLDKLKLNAIEQMMAFETSKAFVAGQAGPNYPAPVEAITFRKPPTSAVTRRWKSRLLASSSWPRPRLPKAWSACSSAIRTEEEGQGLRQAGPRRETGCRTRRRHHGWRHRLPVGRQGHADPDEGYPRRGYPDGPGRSLQAARQACREGPSDAGEDGAGAQRDSSDHVLRRLRQCRHRRGSRGREPEGQARRAGRGGRARTRGRDHRLNTSTISISYLAQALKRPENFCGMHFFNPVHMMPLVEVIRGEKTSETAIATTVAYAKKMGKSPVVVNDCPGFLVNRVLFPYFGGFARAIAHGVDFVRADKVMEKFGWPMGPAYLMDVVGMDTGHHGRDVMAEGFPIA